jgi:hypothetical protein
MTLSLVSDALKRRSTRLSPFTSPAGTTHDGIRNPFRPSLSIVEAISIDIADAPSAAPGINARNVEAAIRRDLATGLAEEHRRIALRRVPRACEEVMPSIAVDVSCGHDEEVPDREAAGR